MCTRYSSSVILQSQRKNEIFLGFSSQKYRRELIKTAFWLEKNA